MAVPDLDKPAVAAGEAATTSPFAASGTVPLSRMVDLLVQLATCHANTSIGDSRPN